MIITEQNKEVGLLAGYPVRKTFFKNDEVLHFDKINKQWIAKVITQVSGMRGVAVYHQVDEPTNQEDGDIWIVRQPI